MTLRDLAEKVRTALFGQQIISPIPQQKTTFNVGNIVRQVVPQALRMTPITGPIAQIQPTRQAIQNIGQNYPQLTQKLLKFEQPVQKVSRFMQQPYNYTGLSQAASKIRAPIPRIGAQFGAGLAEAYINLPSQIVGGATKTGLNIGRSYRGEQVKPQTFLAGAAPIGEALLTSWIPGASKNIVKNASEQALKQTFKQSIKEGVKQGAVVGGTYGLFEGFKTGEDLEKADYFGNLLKKAGGGVVIGGLLGGGTSGTGYLIGRGRLFVAGKVKSIFPQMSDEQAQKVSDKFIRDELGRFAKGKKGKDQPPFYGDLREKLGLPRNGNYEEGSIKIPESPFNKSITQSTGGVGGVSNPTGKNIKLSQNVDQTGNIKLQPQPESGIPIRTMANQEVSSAPIITEKGKLNLNKLKVEGEGKQVLENLNKEVKPTVIGNKEVVAAAKTATGSRAPMSDAQMKNLLAQQLKNRQKVVDLSAKFNSLKKSGASETELGKTMLDIANQSKTARQGGTFAGRILQAQNIIADKSASPMQRILALLDNAGVNPEKYLKDSVKVNWDNPKEVVGFYRKYVPPSFGEVLTEIRYTNMLSSPITHIINTASNALQTGVVTPIEKTISGVLDFGRTKITGKERQYYARSGIDYIGGYVKSLPQAIKKASNILSDKEISIRPDFEYIPTTVGGPLKAYTTPLRALEAMDQFFKTLVQGGVTAELKNAPIKISAEGIASKAEKEATYRLFRQGFDPNGELGQGKVLQLFDKWNSAIANLRRLPGGRWVLPFLQTPTNILKQGLEYSPLGVSTTFGAKAPIEQLSKTIIGTGVFISAYQLAKSGLVSWEAPSGETERDLYYAAGLQPYSVKIGNKWVSFSKLGPLAYPIAMASALANAEKYGPDKSKIDKVSQGMMGMLGFFGDQSYVRSIGDLVDAIQGGVNVSKSAVTSEAANLAGQLVPYRSFFTWLGRMIDPVYRKASTFSEKMVKDLPVVGTNLKPYTDINNNPSLRDYPVANSFNPYKITQEKGSQEQLYRQYEQGEINRGIEKRQDQQFLQNSQSGNIQQIGTKIRYVNQDGDLKTFDSQEKANVYKAKEQVLSTGEPITVDNVFYYQDGDTVKTVDLSFQLAPPTLSGLTELDKKAISKYNSEITKKANDIYELYKQGQLTEEEANTQLEQLKNLKVSATKKPKKISVPKITFKKLKVTMPKTTTIKALKIPSPPKIKGLKNKKTKTIKVSAIKSAKLKGLTNSIKLV